MKHYLAHDVRREDRPDGAILLRSAHDPVPPDHKTSDWLHRWAAQTPDAVFLAERSGAGWRELRYGEALERVRALAAGLLARGHGPGARILIISGNSVDHGVLALAAQYVGLVPVPVAEQYSLIPGALKQLSYITRLIDPDLVYAEDGSQFATALAMDEMAGRRIVVGRNPGPGMSLLPDLERDHADVEAAAAAVGPDTVAKILMTSGSTSNPKGVLTTQAMLCANQAQYTRALPFLSERPPRLVDWLPWNHVFGGSNNFNQMLAFGGALYIDGGKPAPALIGKTFENNRLMNGTIAYNVPVGFAQLRDEMRRDPELKRHFFADLDMLFYAGASLPADVWRDLSDMAAEVRDTQPLITTCWGMTETAPACIFQHVPANLPGIIGVPLTGVTAKLAPAEGGGHELRVKGPNVFKGYLDNPEKTAEAFDEEGFFCTGDKVSLVDATDAKKGLKFDGRIAEEFKLTTGIWVPASDLRLEVLAALAPLASDVVLTGEGRSEVGAMIVPAPALAQMLEARGGVCLPGEQAEEIAGRLSHLNAGRGSATSVARVLILSEPPSMAEGEITAKGNLNFRKILTRRADLVARLYDRSDETIIFVH
ncbi:feruloyl-CoA synthase [Ruegeria marina]|uniref:Feruloyl-CoA synthase n=1 Tax=Ruegeria marina TaxID=639004 RepID=A0A1G6PA66_9RHOB|nr:feruloyl-CoA synthase [Ruegeria marina]SDC77023.1 feruloyl-CoA synthase [Ruegeria marina]